jgi:hypothetical protein
MVVAENNIGKTHIFNKAKYKLPKGVKKVAISFWNMPKYSPNTIPGTIAKG